MKELLKDVDKYYDELHKIYFMRLTGFVKFGYKNKERNENLTPKTFEECILKSVLTICFKTICFREQQIRRNH